MITTDDPLAPFRRFRLTAVRIALALTALGAAATFLLSRAAAQGVLMGGIAGVLGFWIIAVRLEKLAKLGGEKVNFAVLTWTTLRFALYGVVLYRAFTLDRETMHGLLGAAGGLFIIRFVLMFMGFTGIDLKHTAGARRGGP